ncbi:monocarboxylate transporter 12 [Cephus cinctus]|uniref:Monocarboxylate transporter 12 n=1 Tax=Cephus cinctus TaxID=211228 RepID=A0AAJ7RVD8_CEPCN|nr:monocarboxylate transporter 12 [Cephus cinctus]XP_015610447.1 monocarboxylate transporter 12 [Cephus cinctus]XP_015610456.1 monocarboxylate transporter 12 [Cephus cinctus]XP_024947846.1 monocarboxylate transporter 12 [Cephus cinctus]XP_024947848.1 monocarboxylate transporter 12 [Cephus cinctus]XP_024947853.1 monocarboxylate transporter 12 [Cephus cinctus]
MARTTENQEELEDPAVERNGYKSNDIQLEDFGDKNNEEIEVEMLVPPDGGWGWVVVAASFMCNVFVDGIISSFGIFLNDIGSTFGVSRARVALVGSLQTGFYLMAGPVVSALANRYGFRLVTILGSVMSCMAFSLSYFSNSIEFISITYGVLGGIGLGLIYIPAVIITGFYFERWRALATGISVCGSGIGTFLLAPVMDLLKKNFDWKVTLLVQGGMLLSCVIFGALFRPLKPTLIKVKANEDNTELDVKTSFIGKAVSTRSLYLDHPHSSRLYGTNNNTQYPTAAELIGSSPNIANSRSLHSLHKVQVDKKMEKKLSKSEKRLSVPIYPELDIVNDQELKTVEEENNLLGGDLERLNGRIPTIRRHTVTERRTRRNSDSSQKSFKTSRRNTMTKDTQRPFYRDDIFYGGSLHRLPHYKSQISSVGYHMSVTRLPTATDMEEEESGSCYLCPESVRRILSTMLDVSLLKSPTFLVLAASGALTMMGFYTPFVYLQARAESAGMEPSKTMFLLSVVGIGNTIGRVACGIISSFPGVNALLVNNVFISIAGLATVFSGKSLTQEYQFLYAACFGLSISVFVSLRSILVVDLLGLEKLTNAFGLLLLFQGVAATIGAPLAGAFIGPNGDYDFSFYLSGSLIFVSAVICYPLGRINQWEKNRERDRVMNVSKS